MKRYLNHLQRSLAFCVALCACIPCWGADEQYTQQDTYYRVWREKGLKTEVIYVHKDCTSKDVAEILFEKGTTLNVYWYKKKPKKRDEPFNKDKTKTMGELLGKSNKVKVTKLKGKEVFTPAGKKKFDQLPLSKAEKAGDDEPSVREDRVMKVYYNYKGEEGNLTKKQKIYVEYGVTPKMLKDQLGLQGKDIYLYNKRKGTMVNVNSEQGDKKKLTELIEDKDRQRIQDSIKWQQKTRTVYGLKGKIVLKFTPQGPGDTEAEGDSSSDEEEPADEDAHQKKQKDDDPKPPSKKGKGSYYIPLIIFGTVIALVGLVTRYQKKQKAKHDKKKRGTHVSKSGRFKN